MAMFLNVDITTKLISFGANGVNVFQGVHNAISHQIKNKFALHLEGIHCMAHCMM
jgi:hypothetical protein